MKEILLFVVIGFGEGQYFTTDMGVVCNPFTGQIEFPDGSKVGSLCLYTDVYGDPIYINPRDQETINVRW